MSKATEQKGSPAISDARLRRRYRQERLFRLAGVLALGFALAALLALLASVASRSVPALTHSFVRVELVIEADSGDEPLLERLARTDFRKPIRTATRSEFEDAKGRKAKRELDRLFSVGAEYDVRDFALANPGVVGTPTTFLLPLSDDADLFLKGEILAEVAEGDRKISDRQIAWLSTWLEAGRIDRQLNTRFLTEGDSREPELAGMQGAIRGSILTLLVTLLISFPIGVGAALYLEEFAPRNRWTDLVEVNINNLAAVPSIIFGLLGLAVFLNFFGLPRSAPMVGGLVLALMTLPTIIIAGRAALAAVPPSIREAALALGATPTQAVFHQVLPQAIPGILTGTILGMARALGETAPLLMIGMVAFVADLPSGVSDPSTVLPVQIYLWNDAPERAFVARTAAGIMVLLSFLILMNAAAVWVRSRFESKGQS